MRKLSLRGMLDRKLRVGLTAVAVLLGVTMISGTFVFTDTINRAFDRIFEEASDGADIVVSGKQELVSQFSLPPSLDQELVDRIKKLNGVNAVNPQITDYAVIIGKDGKPVKTGGAPNLGFSFSEPPFDGFQISAGRSPQAPDEVVIDTGTAKDQGYKPGDSVKIAAENGIESFKLVGVGQFGGSGFGGATIALFQLETAQRLFNKQGRVDSIDIDAASGVKSQSLISQIKPLLDSDAEIRTADEEAQRNSEDITDSLGFLTTALLAFGFIAVFVGAFIIFNTFSITVAQRRKEFALLRMIGAMRSQILKSVVLEALLIGVVSSVAGLFLGLAAAKGINSLFTSVGIELPTTDLVLLQRTVVVSMLVGVLVTLFASLAPAIKATRVAPIEALRDSVLTEPKRGVKSLLISLFVIAAGALLLASGLLSDGGTTSQKLGSAAGGAIVVVIGIALFSPRIVPYLARIVGWPIERVARLTGRLARENSQRNPGRTSITAAALMIGLSLVLFVTIFANGLRASANESIDQAFKGDFIVQSLDGFTPIPAGVLDAVRKDPTIEVASALRLDQAKVKTSRGGAEKLTTIYGLESSTFSQVYSLDWIEGSEQLTRELGDGEVLVEQSTADGEGLKVGSTVEVKTPVGTLLKLTVAGVYKDDFVTGYMINDQLFAASFDQPRLASVVALLKPGVTVAQGSESLIKTLNEYPQAEVSSQTQLKEQVEEQVNSLLALIYALLSMSVIVSLFGIVNTLTLSIYERIRELGLLRAVGMSRRQIWQMITAESVITASIGAVLGLVLGIFFAAVVTRAVSSDGIAFVIPWGQVLVLMVVAVIAGVVAAVIPSFRAARINVLEAISRD